MKPRLIHQDQEHHRTFFVAYDKGEDPVSLLTEFARANGLAGSQVTAIGAFERAVLGYFDRAEREYRKILIKEQTEVLSLLGDVAHQADGRPVVHLHAVLGRHDGTTCGGHLIEASVWPTLELVLTEWPRHLRKRFDPDVGLALLPAHSASD